MNITLRQEKPSDHLAIAEVIIAAYSDVWYSDNREQYIVERLRNSNAFIHQLSIVAEIESGDLAGHVLLTKITIQNQDQSYPALALAPLSVKPEFQNKGIGSKLIIESHRVAKVLGYQFIVILGMPDYYLKFGYSFLGNYDINVPIEIAERNCFIISLTGDDFSKVRGGEVKYPEAFFG